MWDEGSVFLSSFILPPSSLLLDLHPHDLVVSSDELVADLHADLKAQVGGLERDDGAMQVRRFACDGARYLLLRSLLCLFKRFDGVANNRAERTVRLSCTACAARALQRRKLRDKRLRDASNIHHASPSLRMGPAT